MTFQNGESSGLENKTSLNLYIVDVSTALLSAMFKYPPLSEGTGLQICCTTNLVSISYGVVGPYNTAEIITPF